MMFRPDIKPPMWGSPDAVQYAVRHNAERLGIDSEDLVAVYPFWELAGTPFEVMSGGDFRNDTLKTSQTWLNDGYLNNNSEVDSAARLEIPTGHAGPRNCSLFYVGSSLSSYGAGVLGRSSTSSILAWRNSGSFAIRIGGKDYSSAGIWNYGQNYKYSLEAGLSSVRVIVDGDIIISGTEGGTTAFSEFLDWGVDRHGGGGHNFNAKILLLIAASVDTQQLHETPYALLMPVSRPFIFDMAGGGFAIYSVLQSQGVTAPAVEQKISVTISSVAQGQTVDPQTVLQSHTVSPANVSQTQSVDAQAVTQLVSLSLADVTQAQTVEPPTLAQTHGITTDSVSQGQTATTLTAAQLHEIITANVGQSQTLNSVTVSITGALVIHSVTQSQSAGSVLLDHLISIAVDSVLQGQAIDQPSFATVNLINIDDVSQSQSLGTVALSQVSALIIEAINQGQQIENVNFSIAEGRVTVTIEARSPGATFDARKPGITFN